MDYKVGDQVEYTYAVSKQGENKTSFGQITEVHTFPVTGEKATENATKSAPVYRIRNATSGKMSYRVFEKLVGFYESEDEDTSKSSNDSGAKAKKSKK